MLTFKISVKAQEKNQDCCETKISARRNTLDTFAPDGQHDLHIPRNVAPSGLPTCLSLRLGSAFEANISNMES